MKKSIILSFILLCATQLCFAITIQSKDVIVANTNELVTKTTKAEQVKEADVMESNVVSDCCRTESRSFCFGGSFDMTISHTSCAPTCRMATAFAAHAVDMQMKYLKQL